MVRNILLKYSDEEHREFEQIKNESGLSWDRFVAKCIREHFIRQELDKKEDMNDDKQ